MTDHGTVASMDPLFKDLVESLDSKFRDLIEMTPVKAASLPKSVPSRGVYLFSEKGVHLYVGRTNNLKGRIRAHSGASSGENRAALAFRIGRHDTGKLKASYKREGSRKELMKDEAFLAAFTSAKSRLADMELRYVEESDPTKQALLEIYVATVLRTPFNDFDNH